MSRTAASNSVPLPRSTPSQEGLAASSIGRFLDGVAEQALELHSLMILRHGKVIAEGWWSPYAPDRRHLLYSLSKSFTSTAIGMAIEEGLMSLDDRVVSYFPEKTPTDATENLLAITIRNLLTMSTGQIEADRPALGVERGRDWVAEFLSQPTPLKPGTKFDYSTMATYMCSAILNQVAGMDLLDYLTPRLFEPLGITEAHWQRCPSGLSVGGSGLSLTTESIAKFGQLYLQKGIWEGKQLVSAGWVALATSKRIDNDLGGSRDWSQGYGFQFWQCQNGAYRGDGAFGQYCVVLPDQEMVIAITSSLSDMQAVLNLVWDCILPGVDKTEGDVDALRERLTKLSVPGPQPAEPRPGATSVNGHYVTEEPEAPLGSWKIEFSEESASLVLKTKSGGEVRYDVGLNGWVDCPSTGETALSGKGAWVSANRFVAEFHDLSSPKCVSITFEFDGEVLSTTTAIRGHFGPLEGPSFRGRREI